MAAEAGGGRSRGSCSQEAEGEERWSSAHFGFSFRSGPQPRMVLLTFLSYSVAETSRFAHRWSQWSRQWSLTLPPLPAPCTPLLSFPLPLSLSAKVPWDERTYSVMCSLPHYSTRPQNNGTNQPWPEISGSLTPDKSFLPVSCLSQGFGDGQKTNQPS